MTRPRKHSQRVRRARSGSENFVVVGGVLGDDLQDDAALGQHLLDHPEAQREAEVQPDRVGNDRRGIAMAGIRRKGSGPPAASPRGRNAACRSPCAAAASLASSAGPGAAVALPSRRGGAGRSPRARRRVGRPRATASARTRGSPPAPRRDARCRPAAGRVVAAHGPDAGRTSRSTGAPSRRRRRCRARAASLRPGAD